MAEKQREKQPAAKSFKLPESLLKVVNAKIEDGPVAEKLKEISNADGSVFLAFIAPYTAVRVSPIEERSASIRMAEEWGIEYVLSEIEERCCGLKKKTLNFLINSPGGIPASCYNIAHMIQSCFSQVKVFVPQVALSGGTLLALSGNKLVMGMGSRLSPFDVQVSYKDTSVSAYSISKALSRLNNFFSTKTPDEAPYPYKAMADKLDPVILEDWTTSLTEVGGYADEILETAKYEKKKRESIIRTLVFTDKTHSYVIHRKRAKEMGLNISEDARDIEVLNIMRQWLAQYAFEKEATHCIRYICPKGSKDNDNNKNRKKAK